MNILILTFVFCLVDLALTQKNTRLGVVETARPTNFPSSIEFLATIQIEIGDLSGSGVIHLSNVAVASESGTPINQTSIMNAGPLQAESIFTSCIKSYLPETTATVRYVAPSTMNFNATRGVQPPLRP